MTLKQHNLNFVNYELVPGVNTIKDFSEAVYTMGDHEGTLKIEFDKVTMKTKLTLTRYSGTIGTLRFVIRSFFLILINFEPFWDYKPTNANDADSPGVYLY